ARIIARRTLGPARLSLHDALPIYASFKPLGDLAQQFVTGIVTQGIVNTFEPVKIEEHQRCRLTTATTTADHMIEPIPEQLTISQTGKRIIERQTMQLRLGRF